MPWKIKPRKKSGRTVYLVISSSGNVAGEHDTKESARKQQKFLYANQERFDAALPDIYFDVRSQRWRYRDSRKFAPMAAVRSRAIKYRNQQQTAMIDLATRYSDGKLSLDDFQKEAAKKLKSIHLAEMIRALDKQGDATGDRFLLVGRNLKEQYYSGIDRINDRRFGLKYLFRDIVDGKVSDARLKQRITMFSQSGKKTYWGTKLSLQEGKTQARRILAPVEHCTQCIEYAFRGWVAIADVILPTVACSCATNCKCTLEFR